MYYASLKLQMFTIFHIFSLINLKYIESAILHYNIVSLFDVPRPSSLTYCVSKLLSVLLSDVAVNLVWLSFISRINNDELYVYV